MHDALLAATVSSLLTPVCSRLYLPRAIQPIEKESTSGLLSDVQNLLSSRLAAVITQMTMPKPDLATH